MNNFYKKFQEKTDSELERILNDPSSYTEDALLAATQILKERKVKLPEELKVVPEKIEVHKENRRNESSSSILSIRIIAFIIDLFILSGVSFLIGYLLMGSPLVIDPWGELISLVLILGYFTFFNSNIGKKTVGKYLMNIRVGDYHYQPISFTESLKRYSLLILPYFLFNLLDYLPFNTFGVLEGLRYSYYIGIIYFLITDKGLRRSFHDLLTHSFVMSVRQENTNFDYPLKKVKMYFFIASGVIILFVGMSVLTSNMFSGIANNIQAEQLEATLNENMSIFEIMISDIQKIDGVAELEGINMNTTDGITSLEITIRPNLFISTSDLSDKVYESLKGKKLKINSLDNIKIIEHYGFDLELASYNKMETKTFKQ